ncbi:MAG: DUF1801 domain-containing protein [Bacteroidetes bacterium]|nr:DUF1801 domain-containing protein [Bacteroidota bacterium]
MRIKANSIEENLSQISDDRKIVISSLRKIILDNLPKGYKETVQYGAISFIVPLEKFSINGQPIAYISIASQKNYMALYLNCYEPIPEWFIKEYKASGKKLDTGKSCIWFKNLENLPLDIIPKVVTLHSVDELIDVYKKSQKKIE